MDAFSAIEARTNEPAWVSKAREVGHNRLVLAGAMLLPNLLAEMTSHITSGKNRSHDWLIKKVPILNGMNAIFHGGMEAIEETKNPIMKVQRFARAFVGSAPTSTGMVAAAALLSALA